MLLSNLKKYKKISTIAEAALAATYISINTYAREIIKATGQYFIPLLPIIDIAKLIIYWKESNGPDYKKGPLSKWMNRSFYIIKAAASIVGVAIAATLSLSTGMLVIVGASYLRAIRAGYRTYRNLRKGEIQKAKGHFGKLVLSLLFSSGPTLLLFFPPLALVGWTCFIGAALYVGTKNAWDLASAHENRLKINAEHAALTPKPADEKNDSSPSRPVTYIWKQGQLWKEDERPISKKEEETLPIKRRWSMSDVPGR